MAHTWIAMVDKTYRGKGLSTDIDLACTNLIAGKGFDFTYGQAPFKSVKGGAAAYVLGIKPGVQIESLQNCYTTGSTNKG